MKDLLQTVVVAVSGSEASIQAAKYGIALAKCYRCRLLAVYVVDTATLKELLLSKIFVEDESAEYEKGLEQNGRRYLNYVVELAAKKGIEVEKLLRKGAISTEIVEAAEDNHADLILLGGFEDKGILRDALSRQHREIMKHAKCSILVVKEPDIESLYRKL
ncbi:MAG: universal stress protein [Spirochaetia bacterium]|jgi:nucleotide-binding universal stress UspA family protein